MLRTRIQILKTLEENREAIVRLGVRSLGLFGSAARGDSASGSDLDFLVEFERKSFDGYMDLKEFLEKLFRCPVDLVLADGIKPRLREAILRETVHVAGL
jgi:predicted nucleotidyltransferase